MNKPSSKQVADIRTISRTLVRELGFMNRNIAQTDLSASAVHAIVEIGLAKSLSANDLQSLLLLEKSSVSRLLQTLLKKRLVSQTTSTADSRIKLIKLTNEGKQKLRIIDAYADSRISSSLEHLANDDYRTVLQGVNLYAESLTKGRLNSQ